MMLFGINNDNGERGFSVFCGESRKKFVFLNFIKKEKERIATIRSFLTASLPTPQEQFRRIVQGNISAARLRKTAS